MEGGLEQRLPSVVAGKFGGDTPKKIDVAGGAEHEGRLRRDDQESDRVGLAGVVRRHASFVLARLVVVGVVGGHNLDVETLGLRDDVPERKYATPVQMSFRKQSHDRILRVPNALPSVASPDGIKVLLDVSTVERESLQPVLLRTLPSLKSEQVPDRWQRPSTVVAE